MRILLLIFISLIIFSCQRQWHVAEVDPDTYRFDRYNKIQEDAEINALIQPYKKQLDVEMNEVIGQVKNELIKAKPESTLGNFLADLILKQAEDCTGKTVDFAAQNYGGIRVPAVGKGGITRGKTYEIMPFENMLSVLEIKGDIANRLIQRMAASGGWPISHSLHFVIQDDQAGNITIHGEPLDMNKTYIIALPDYVANGGDNCDFLIEQTRIPCGISIRDAMINHIIELTEAGEVIDPELTGRITIN